MATFTFHTYSGGTVLRLYIKPPAPHYPNILYHLPLIVNYPKVDTESTPRTTSVTMKYNFIMIFLGLIMCFLAMVGAAPTADGPPTASYNVSIGMLISSPQALVFRN